MRCRAPGVLLHPLAPALGWVCAEHGLCVLSALPPGEATPLLRWYLIDRPRLLDRLRATTQRAMARALVASLTEHPAIGEHALAQACDAGDVALAGALRRLPVGQRALLLGECGEVDAFLAAWRDELAALELDQRSQAERSA